MAKNSVGSVSMDLLLNSKGFSKGIASAANQANNAFSSSMKKIGGYIATAFSIAAITAFTKKSIDAASQMQSAWTGLKSIADGTGNSFISAQKFINEYTKDGLVSVNEAVTAYKNLLARGYDTTQIEKTMTALKDSASFGRQASYDLGEAVVTATEGLKNENSILVDNAGVTKNVAKMWEEWAAAHGTTTSAMTQAQKIEAEYNGILQETRFQTGDAATYTKTFGGQVQMLKMSFTNLKVAVGEVVAPIAGLFIPVINAALVAITNFFNGLKQVLAVFGLSFPSVVSKTSSGIANVGKTAVDTAGDIASTGKAAKKAAKEIKRAFAPIDEINVLNTKDTSSSDSGSGSGASGGSAGVEVAPTVASDNAVETAISGTMDKIMKYIKPLQEIKFDNLINAFNNLKEAVKYAIGGVGTILEGFYFNFLVPLADYVISDALPHFLNSTADAIKSINFDKVTSAFNELWKSLEPFAENVGNGLLWLYDHVLLPLGKWTINDVLPSFLHALSGAIDVANQAIEDLTPIWQLFWDNVLQPIASWTGGVIVDTLNGIGDALKWISDNEVAMALLEGLAVSIGLVAGAIAIYNGVMAICNVVTGIFSGILAVLTSPITLVVLAIGALIAIIILCVKHWDEIKEACGKAMEKIKEVVQAGVEKVKEFFNGIINFVKNNWQGILMFIVNPFAGAFKLLYDNCEDFRNTINNMLEAVKNAFSKAFNAIKNTVSNIWNGILGLFSKGGKIFSGVVDGIAGVFKTIVNTMISGINRVISAPFRTINSALTRIKNIDILGSKPFRGLINTISIPQIPMLAQGGYAPARNPQLAIIGDNTREGEIVTPESKIYEQVNKALKDNQNVGKQEIELHLYHHYEDGRTIIQKVNQAQLDAGEVLLLT